MYKLLQTIFFVFFLTSCNELTERHYMSTDLTTGGVMATQIVKSKIKVLDTLNFRIYSEENFYFLIVDKDSYKLKNNYLKYFEPFFLSGNISCKSLTCLVNENCFIRPPSKIIARDTLYDTQLFSFKNQTLILDELKLDTSSKFSDKEIRFVLYGTFHSLGSNRAIFYIKVKPKQNQDITNFENIVSNSEIVKVEYCCVEL